MGKRRLRGVNIEGEGFEAQNEERKGVGGGARVVVCAAPSSTVQPQLTRKLEATAVTHQGTCFAQLKQRVGGGK